MTDPKITLIDPRSVNSPRKIALAARVEAMVESGVELTSIKFKEPLHPRDVSGKFIKNPFAKKKTYTKTWDPIPKSQNSTDVRDKVLVEGDQGFKDVLVGLALGAINEVHDVPVGLQKLQINEIKLKAKTDDLVLMGQYHIGTNKLDIDPKSSTESALTAIHEIGHFFDFNWKKNNNTSNFETLNLNGALLVALHNSAPYKRVDNALKTRTDLTKDQREFGEYLQDTRELFARAYTQYIVTRSSNQTLKKEFNTVRERGGTYHWDDKDFEPIGKVFDTIFHTKPKPAPKKKK